MIDLSANRIKQKCKRHGEVDKSKVEKNKIGKMACTDTKGWQFLKLGFTKNATPLFKMYKLLAKGLMCIRVLPAS